MTYLNKTFHLNFPIINDKQRYKNMMAMILKGVSEKTSHFDFCIFRLSVHFLLSSHETETFHSFNYGLRFPGNLIISPLKTGNKKAKRDVF